MLNLREMYFEGGVGRDHQPTTTVLGRDSQRFAVRSILTMAPSITFDVVGNLGGPLELDPSGYEGEEEDDPPPPVPEKDWVVHPVSAARAPSPGPVIVVRYQQDVYIS